MLPAWPVGMGLTSRLEKSVLSQNRFFCSLLIEKSEEPQKQAEKNENQAATRTKRLYERLHARG